MKLIKILIIVLFFSTNVLSDTIYYLLKIPNLEIIDIKNNNSIKTFKAKKYFKVGIKDNNVECYSPSNLLVKEKQKLIRENIDLYSKVFLNKINLRFIVLCKDLEVASIPALGIPNHPLKTELFYQAISTKPVLNIENLWSLHEKNPKKIHFNILSY